MKVRELIYRYTNEMNGTAQQPGVKPLTQREHYHFAFLLRQDIAEKDAEVMTRFDIIDHCRVRKLGGAGQPTILHDLRCLTNLVKYATSAWQDCEKVSIAPIIDAKPFLLKNGYIGKGNPRKRRPTDEEIHKLLNFFEEENQRGRNTIKAMPDIIAFALVSARRRGEICRITHGDVAYEQKVYWVRDMKHPSQKKGNDKAFILWPELEAIIWRQPRIDPNNPAERIFPFNGNVVGQKYCYAKKKLGIQGLRFHDSRARAISTWLLKMPVEDVRVAVSGHNSNAMLERVYDRRNSADLIKEKYSALLTK